jgi:hypothetical protein
MPLASSSFHVLGQPQPLRVLSCFVSVSGPQLEMPF